jgi:hypothetical protein
VGDRNDHSSFTINDLANEGVKLPEAGDRLGVFLLADDCRLIPGFPGEHRELREHREDVEK